MKFFVVVSFVLVMFAVMLSGCAGIQKATCDNRDRINAIIVQEQVFIQNLENLYGPMIPANIQAIIAIAQQVIANAQAMLAAYPCPDDAQVGDLAAQAGQTRTMADKVKMGVK